MKKFLIIILGLFIWSSSSLAEIVFDNCDLSPNYGKVSMIVNLEKKQIKFEDNLGVSKILKINEINRTTLSASDNNNGQIDELFMIDITQGVISVKIKPSNIANQSTKDLLKNKKSTINALCKPKNLYAKEEQQKQGVVMNAVFEQKILRAKVICKRAGYKWGTNKEKDDMMGCLNYRVAKEEEQILRDKLKAKANLDLNSTYESKSGKKINKDSKWTKFWEGIGWILHEHGDELFKVILDVKYGTNYAGYKTETPNNGARIRCTGQRVGDYIYENCRGGGVHIKCTTVIIGDMAKRRCREV
jgi:hypothetical protein